MRFVATQRKMSSLNVATFRRNYVYVHAEDVALYTPENPEPLRGRDSIRHWYGGFVNGFPDMSVKRERLFAHGEWVCGEYAISGTHTGPVPGPGGQEIPVTNERVKISSATVYRVQGGNVTEVHEYFDQLSYLTQLGLTE